MLMDVVTDFGTYNGKDYIPHNYNDQSYGPVSMRQAMAGSLNVPAVKTLDLVGVDNAVQTAHDLGITSPLADCGLSLVLGGCEVRLLDHVAAYSVIANEGVKNPETPILKILDKNGNILEQYQSNPQNVLDPQDAYELISIMTDNNARTFIFGANSPLILPGPGGGRQNRHHAKFPRRLDIGLYAFFGRRRVGGQQRRHAVKKRLRRRGCGRADLARFYAAGPGHQHAGNFYRASGDYPGYGGFRVRTFANRRHTANQNRNFCQLLACPRLTTMSIIKVAFDATTGQPATSLTPPANITYKYLQRLSQRNAQ